MIDFQTAIAHYWQSHPAFAAEARAAGHRPEEGQLPVRGIMFDMDGVLFDSMPYHSKSWARVCNEYGLHITEEEVYLNEGRTGFSTINWLTERQWGKRRPQERGTKKMGYMKYLKLMNRMNAVTQVPQPPVPQFEKYCKLFVTDEEYDIMMGMKLRGNTEAELRALYTGSDWAGTLYDMCRKGFLLKIYDGAEPTYDLAPDVPLLFRTTAGSSTVSVHTSSLLKAILTWSSTKEAIPNMKNTSANSWAM